MVRFDRPTPPEKSPVEPDMMALVEPLLERLTFKWADENKTVRGLRLPNMRILWAEHLGLIERRRTLYRRRWMIRRKAF